jgi:hypothetical protein
VTDLDEAGGQDMEQEAADELHRIELHDTAVVVMSGVSPAEAHLAVIEAEESSVGDGKRGVCSVPDTSAHARVLRTEAWSRRPTLVDAAYAAESEMRAAWIVQPACRRSIVSLHNTSEVL